MLKVNGHEVEIGNFPDRTMLINGNVSDVCFNGGTIEWYYENDTELVALIFLTKHLRANGCPRLELFMPYIPNARQDRVKSYKDVFTLKYFAEVINDYLSESDTNIKTDKLKVLVGHTPLQVLFGALLGIAVSVFYQLVIAI